MSDLPSAKGDVERIGHERAGCLFSWRGGLAIDTLEVVNDLDRLRFLARGLPGILGLILGIGVALYGQRWTGLRVDTYQRIGRDATDARTRLLAQRRLIDFGVPAAEVAWPIARDEAALDLPAARESMRALAPLAEDEIGDGRAHRWLARRMIEESRTPPALALAVEHLQRARLSLELEDEDKFVVRDRLALLSVAQRRHDVARGLLLQPGRDPRGLPVRLAAYDLWWRQLPAEAQRREAIAGERDALAEQLRRMIDLWVKRLPDDDVTRLLLAVVLEMLGEYKDAADLMRGGVDRRADGAERFRAPLVGLLLRWSSAIAVAPIELPEIGRERTEEEQAQRLADARAKRRSARYALLTEAHRHDPDAPEVLVALWTAPGELGQLTRGHLQTLLDGPRGAELRASLGRALLGVGEYSEAREQLRQAREALGARPGLTAALARAMVGQASADAAADQPDGQGEPSGGQNKKVEDAVRQALAMIEEGLQRRPGDLTLRRTRGVVLARAPERASAAIAALRPLADDGMLTRQARREVLGALSSAFARTGEDAEARRCAAAAAALAVDPTLARAWREAGAILWHAGDSSALRGVR